MKHDPISSDPPPVGGIGYLSDAVVRTLIANELDAIRGKLEDMGVQLCAHPVIVREYSEFLQGIDELAQRNENLAKLLRAQGMEAAIETITLESLRNRMLDGVVSYLADMDDEMPAVAKAWTQF